MKSISSLLMSVSTILLMEAHKAIAMPTQSPRASNSSSPVAPEHPAQEEVSTNTGYAMLFGIVTLGIFTSFIASGCAGTHNRYQSQYTSINNAPNGDVPLGQRMGAK